MYYAISVPWTLKARAWTFPYLETAYSPLYATF